MSGMTDEQRIWELVQKVLDTNKLPEEVCTDCPELLWEVQNRWKQARRVDSQLEALFPSSDSAPPQAAIDKRQFLVDGQLPAIPGYEVDAVLGHGGMGVVYKGRHVKLNRPVALKMMIYGACATSSEQAHFQREAEAIAALHHPHIVQIYDVGEADGRPYYAMEFLEGGSFAKRLAGKPQPAAAAASYSLTLAEAVQAAHDAGIVHRDLKPSNILLAADGALKISDFGLARRLDVDQSLTLTAANVGTPSYMAPEQALGKANAFSPAVDIYALGAILYEMLTGRPPFRAETAAETQRQLIAKDPVPPSRLNASVPRDLETICLKCLQKEPGLRYPSSVALAEDLHRFLQGEAIVARPQGRFEKFARRVGRHPALAAALAAVSLTIITLLGSGIWLISERVAAEHREKAEQAAIERAADEDLQDMVAWQQKSAWPEATAALERAKGRLGAGGSVELRNRLDQGVRDMELTARLDAIRLRRANQFGDKAAFSRSDKDYEEAFSAAGLGGPQEAPEAVATRIKASHIGGTLVAALDDWTSCAFDRPRQDWILEVARQSDQDPIGWRTRARDSKIWKDNAALAKFIETVPVSSESVPLLLMVAERVKSIGGDPIPFLKRVQDAHPGDFWANLGLAEALMGQNHLAEAIRFYQAAIAIRPGAAVLYDNLGMALALLGRIDEADEQFRKASAIDPAATLAHSNLGIAFSTAARRNEAIEGAELPQHFKEQVANLHVIIGDKLRDEGKLAEALDRYRQAIAVDAKFTWAQQGLRSVLLRQGQIEAARLAWTQAIDAAPPDYNAWDGYAELCLFCGQDAEYRRARRELLDRFGRATDPKIAERTGRACLLMPSSPEELKIAEALVDRALASEPDEPYYKFAKGLAEYRAGRLESVISLMTGDAARAMGPAPRLVQAMAEYALGRKAEARKTLAAAIGSLDWRSAADTRDVWIFHVLRREAETLILPTLHAYLDGKHQPLDNEERFALLDGCRYMNRPCAMARLYTEAFAADPKLAEDYGLGHRLNAARAAALAGCGRGDDGANLSEEVQTRWRAQARAWLELDLAASSTKLDGGNAPDRELVRQRLTNWQSDPDLAGVRDSVALEKLPVKERKEWLALWKNVDVLLARCK
jgi:tetratricopeptide (TPR) repeat protein